MALWRWANHTSLTAGSPMRLITGYCSRDDAGGVGVADVGSLDLSSLAWTAPLWVMSGFGVAVMGRHGDGFSIVGLEEFNF